MMPDDRTFMMGKFAAHLPGQLHYALNHMWCTTVGTSLRFGFTSYAVRLMQDVYFLDWIVDPGTRLSAKQHIGHIETSKAQSDLFAPIPGTLSLFNEHLLDDPTPINVDNYGAGWLFEMTGELEGTVEVDGYYEFLEANWENTQRMLKGHM